MASTDDKSGASKSSAAADKQQPTGTATSRDMSERTAAGDEQVHDTGTERIPADKVANAAAETLHGDRAAVEQYEQPNATKLPASDTLIADEPGEPRAGTLVDDGK